MSNIEIRNNIKTRILECSKHWVLRGGRLIKCGRQILRCVQGRVTRNDEFEQIPPLAALGRNDGRQAQDRLTRINRRDCGDRRGNSGIEIRLRRGCLAGGGVISRIAYLGDRIGDVGVVDFRLHIPDLRFGHSVNPCKFMRYPLPDGRGLLGSVFPQRAVWAEAHPTDY